MTRWSTVRVAGKRYSVSSRLIGERRKVRICYADLQEHDTLPVGRETLS